MPSPNSAVSSGSPIATAEPKVTSRMTTAAMSPMPSDPTGAVWDSAATGAADLDLQRVVAGREDRFDQCLGLAGRELAVVLVEGDVGVRGRAVVGDLAGAAVGERADDAHDVVALGDVGEDLLGPRPHRGRRDTGVGVDHDLHGVAGALAGTGPAACPRRPWTQSPAAGSPA